MTRRIKYVAIDPGSKVGSALFDQEGKFMYKNETLYSDFLHTLTLFMSAPKDLTSDLVFICEDFKLLEHRASAVARNAKSRSMEASKVLGAVELTAKFLGAEIHFQTPEKGTRVASEWTGLKSTGHLADWKSAYNHGIFYLVMNNILKVDEVRYT